MTNSESHSHTQPILSLIFRRIPMMKKIISLLFFCVAFATAIELDLTRTDLITIDKATASELENIKLRLYNGVLTNYVEVRIGESLNFLNELRTTKPIVMYIHGWLGHFNQIATDTVISAYLGLGSYNVLHLDWHNIATQPYTYAARSVEGIGYTAAKALSALVASGVNASSLHIVGHSLGAHVSGFIGKNVNFTLPRITGLDPAGPLFVGEPERLSSNDAQFVDVMHTDAGTYGINQNLGHVDFYPNGGSHIQPGCLLGLHVCSHNNANLYWAESVINKNAFVGNQCSSYAKFRNNFCTSTSTPTAVMGQYALNTTRGEFFLQTNKRSPFGRGIGGLRYHNLDLLDISPLQI